MSRFSTEFPISKYVTKEEFLELVQNWLIQSKNSKFSNSIFTQKKFFEKNKFDTWELENEKLSYFSIDGKDVSELAIKYEKLEKNISYVSEITFATDEERNCKWVGICITNTAKTANTTLPSINKPKLIKEILSFIPGEDSLLNVKLEAHYFTDKEIDFANKLLSGDVGNHLPIVYISIPNNGKHILKADNLAEDLSGIAHVIVEPSRKFSLDLSKLTNGKNTFSGYVGVYWPKGEGRNIIFKWPNKGKIESMSKEIKKSVIQAVSERRQLEVCSWNTIAQKYYQYNSQQIDEYSELLDTASDEMENLKVQNDELREILNSKEEQLRGAEQEIKRLKNDLYVSNKNINSSANYQYGIVLNCDEENLYRDEIKDILLKILHQARDNYDEKSCRKSHILDSVLSLNQMTNHGKDIKRDLKQILKGYSSMNSKVKDGLNKLGFELEEGNHHNLYFVDKRYLFPLSRSSSDKRAIENWISDFCKKMNIN